ncbi:MULTISPECIES: NUDIX domain-containing protein [unclassified Spirosoma]|mgnify:CR=1 FL=1|uniref:NUDIX hydrolase n=1 Tax=unclassified Spirosoma TaxID=2621999 RepID=UPI00096214F4|nr:MULTISPECIES: NUDIX domain-containing protein [unclassified Spirosoma]MBN8821709.1 NUDIX hydrolase [Spirosoma sp.]OJW80794.1 MAG: NUDIX hydrolase [Spirosoma sp. 48-14]
MEYKKELQRLIVDIKTNHLPSVSIDCVIFGFHQGQLKVLLLRWKNTDDWCLPGGRIRKDENMDAAAHRSLRERTGLHEIFLQQFHTFGDINRYRHYSQSETMAKLGLPEDVAREVISRDISVGYYALVEFANVVPTPDLLTDECRWWDVQQIPALLFDHNEMITLALKTLRRQLSYQPIGYNLLPEKFTMPDLQQLYETILGESMDRRNFQKRMLSYGILERLDERKTGGAHKSPYLYRFDKEKYEKALETESLFTA